MRDTGLYGGYLPQAKFNRLARYSQLSATERRKLLDSFINGLWLCGVSGLKPYCFNQYTAKAPASVCKL